MEFVFDTLETMLIIYAGAVAAIFLVCYLAVRTLPWMRKNSAFNDELDYVCIKPNIGAEPSCCPKHFV
jgi:hypothetical protein